jgi:creatinine amidohydrolase
MSTASPTSNLVDLPDSVLWSSRSWPEFAALKSPNHHLVLLPVFGFADWGLGRSIDLEETLGCGVLRAMLAADTERAARLTIMPPLRFALGPYPHSLFGLDYETALELTREIGAFIAAAGLRRLVLLNTSPWNEELMETCACDLRADFGLQTFVINLEALGLDLHPTRSTTRPAVQAAACALTRRAPSTDAPRADIRLADFRPGNHRQPPPLPWTKSLDASVHEGWEVLASAGSRLARLLDAIDAHPPLPNDGAVPVQRAPVAPPAGPTRMKQPARRKGRRTP